MTLYHGTRRSLVPSILRDGLRPGAVGLIWATESREEAQLFAEQLDYPAPNPDVAVIAITAPKGAFFFERPLTRGVRSVVGQRVARFATAVPAAWLEVL